MKWIQTHVTGDAESNAALDKAQKALEDYRGSAKDPEFARLNEAAHEAAQQVPAARRGRWV